MFFADEKEEEAEAKTNAQVVDAPKPTEATTSAGQLFDSSTLAEANDALSSVGWAGVAPMQGMSCSYCFAFHMNVCCDVVYTCV